MREIKFRAWNKEKEEMIYFGLFDTDEGYHIQTQTMLEELPIMQYTGLHDRRGKDIYFGDIVMDGDLGKYKMVVDEVWVANKIIEINDGNNATGAIRIIGNIYEGGIT